MDSHSLSSSSSTVSETSQLSILIREAEAECKCFSEHLKRLEGEIAQVRTAYNGAKSKLEALTIQKNNLNVGTSWEAIEKDWIKPKFPWAKRVTNELKKRFKFTTFRSIQLAAINATLSKKDVIIVMPTGGGKSLIYQLPTVIDSGYAIVVVPLLSLAHDQMIALTKFNIPSAAINSSTTSTEMKETLAKLIDPDTKLKALFVTPEMLHKSKRLMNNLQKAFKLGLIARIVVDEVHCCSTWGHDFRPDYQFLGILKMTFSSVPFLGLTATATLNVLSDLVKQLPLELDRVIITAPFNRPNLLYGVILKATKAEHITYIVNFIRQKYPNKTGIIYTTTIKDAVSVANELKLAGFTAASFHAELDLKIKKRIHEKWLDGKIQVIVATLAFGMGIDKPDVRFVIHYSMPRSMENFYQESGRAGRDGEPADCLIMFSLSDYCKIAATVESIEQDKKALAMLEYCIENQRCRRALLAVEFDHVWDSSQCNRMCDICAKDAINVFSCNLTEICKYLHSIIVDSSEKLTLIKLCERFMKKNKKTYKLDITRLELETIIGFLLCRNYLSIERGFNLYSTIIYIKQGVQLQGPVNMLTCEPFDSIPWERVSNKCYSNSAKSNSPNGPSPSGIRTNTDKALNQDDNASKKLHNSDEVVPSTSSNNSCSLVVKEEIEPINAKIACNTGPPPLKRLRMAENASEVKDDDDVIICETDSDENEQDTDESNILL